MQTGRISMAASEGLWKEWHFIESRNILTPKEANSFMVLRNLMQIIARVVVGGGQIWD